MVSGTVGGVARVCNTHFKDFIKAILLAAFGLKADRVAARRVFKLVESQEDNDQASNLEALPWNTRFGDIGAATHQALMIII